MTTKNSSFSHIIAVWLVLFAFFCGMILPLISHAKEDMESATEGDPTDGFGAAGGGGGFVGEGDDLLIAPVLIGLGYYSMATQGLNWRFQNHPVPVSVDDGVNNTALENSFIFNKRLNLEAKK
jgi:hypothetical protein